MVTELVRVARADRPSGLQVRTAHPAQKAGHVFWPRCADETSRPEVPPQPFESRSVVKSPSGDFESGGLGAASPQRHGRRLARDLPRVDLCPQSAGLLIFLEVFA